MTSKLASWKTGSAGVLSLIAAAAAALADDPSFQKWSGVLAMVSTAIGLFLARDNNVSDQEAGAREEPAKPNGLDPLTK